MATVLVVGSGGREHALGWKLAESDDVEEIIHAPGHAGTAQEPDARNVDIAATDFNALLDLVQEEDVDLTIVGPEQPLAEGLVDFMAENGYHDVFGPRREAARLESDKFFSYDIMDDLGIPQADGIQCHTTDEARAAIRKMATEDGIVIKARGLTGGKGVFVCDSKQEALDRIDEHAERFGEEVLISERLFGEEFSVFGMSDGSRFTPIDVSFQDHKPLLEGGEGPNTGGMGAYGPAPVAPQDIVQHVSEEVMTPIIQEMRARGEEFRGFLYAGMMMTEDGPKVLEFNVRFGDPECQPAMMLMESDLYRMLESCLTGSSIPMDFRPGASCCVVLASDGYPTDYDTGYRIHGLDAVEDLEQVKTFHAGTARDGDDLVTDGGRVLGVTAHGDSIRDARKRAYRGVKEIESEGGFHHRSDIAEKALERDDS